MLRFLLLIVLFCLCLFPLIAEAKCGGGAGRGGRSGFFQRRAEHKQLRVMHRSDNKAARQMKRGAGSGW